MDANPEKIQKNVKKKDNQNKGKIKKVKTYKVAP